jgi:DNA-binding response OmpR family regulator
MGSRILVVEDDPGIAANLGRALQSAGYEVTRAATLGQARRFTSAGSAADFDLVLLDLGLPDGDGADLCRELRAAGSQASVIMLTARADEIDIVMGLDCGAVDYLTKPFRLAELLARVRAHLRADEERSVLVVGSLKVDLGAHRAWVDDQELMLRSKEFELLTALARNPGMALTRERLMSDVWDEHWFGSTKTLDVHISMLRRKLAEYPDGPSIATIRNHGYRLEET